MKAEEKTAYREFIAKIEKLAAEDNGTYFDALLGTAAQVCRNIDDDFGAFVGIFRTEASVKAMQAKHDTALAQKEAEISHKNMIIADQQKHDVRRLRARGQAILRTLAEADGLRKELEQIEAALAM